MKVKDSEVYLLEVDGDKMQTHSLYLSRQNSEKVKKWKERRGERLKEMNSRVKIV